MTLVKLALSYIIYRYIYQVWAINSSPINTFLALYLFYKVERLYETSCIVLESRPVKSTLRNMMAVSGGFDRGRGL